MGAVTTGEQQRDAQGLTLRQAALVELVMKNGSVAQSWRDAGYTDLAGGLAAMKSPKVQDALREARIGVIKGPAAAEALKTMRELLKAPTPPAVRLGAAKWILEKAGHGNDAADEAAIPLHEMSEAQLLRFMARAQGVVDAGGSAPIITVAPDDGA